MILQWPQIVFIILAFIEFYTVVNRGVKTVKVSVALTASFIRIGILLFVLIKGGFFG